MAIQAYYQVPKEIFKMDLSSDAKLLLMEMLDKLKLSMRPENKKNFTDKAGVPFIRLAQETMGSFLHRSLKTVRKAISELIRAGLVIQRRVGLGCCNIYYLAEVLRNLVSPTEREHATVQERKAAPLNNNNFKKHEYRGYDTQKREMQKKYGKYGNLNAHQYTQREYTREQLESLVDQI